MELFWIKEIAKSLLKRIALRVSIRILLEFAFNAVSIFVWPALFRLGTLILLALYVNKGITWLIRLVHNKAVPQHNSEICKEFAVIVRPLEH